MPSHAALTRLAVIAMGAALVCCRSHPTGSTASSTASDTSLPASSEGLETTAPRPLSTLDTSAFMARGMPSPDRPWRAKDYAAATEALRSVKADAYPRIGDPKSGRVFARLTADENFDVIRDDKLPLDSRFPEGIALVGESRKVVGLYLDAVAHGEHVEPELLGLMTTLIETVSSMLDLTETFKKTLNPKDPKYPVRMRGAAQMVKGLAEIARGALMTLTEKKTYALVDLVKFSDALRAPLPKIVSRLDESDRKDITAKVASLEASETDPALKASLGELSHAVSAEPPKPIADESPTP